MYDGYTIVSVTKADMIYKKDENGNLVPMTVQEVEQQGGDVGALGVGSNSNYGITVYITTAKVTGGSSYPTEWLLGGSFEWANHPDVDEGNSVDAFVIGWYGGLAIKANSTSSVVHYNDGDKYPAVVTLTPNAGVGWEFNEAVDGFWSNSYAESGSFSIKIINSTSDAGNIGNVIGQYNHSYETKTLTSLGLSLSTSGGGFSIGWSTTTKVNTVPAYTTYTY